MIGREKFWSLTYTDDMLVTNREKELKEMMKRIQKYLKRKKLKLSAEKSKVMV